LSNIRFVFWKKDKEGSGKTPHEGNQVLNRGGDMDYTLSEKTHQKKGGVGFGFRVDLILKKKREGPSLREGYLVIYLSN